jgi:hypothetical protein
MVQPAGFHLYPLLPTPFFSFVVSLVNLHSFLKGQNVDEVATRRANFLVYVLYYLLLILNYFMPISDSVLETIQD